MLQLLTHDHFDFITCESLRYKSSFNKKTTNHGDMTGCYLEVPTSYWDIKWWHVLTRCQGAGRNWHLPYVSHQRHHKIPSDHWRSHLKIQAVHIWDDVSWCFMTWVRVMEIYGWVFVCKVLNWIYNHTSLNSDFPEIRCFPFLVTTSEIRFRLVISLHTS